MNPIDSIFQIAYFLLGLLPESPVARWLDQYLNGDGQLVQVLHYVNYFVPIESLMMILTAWSALMLAVWAYYTFISKLQ